MTQILEGIHPPRLLHRFARDIDCKMLCTWTTGEEEDRRGGGLAILPLANFDVAIADDQSISRVGDPRREPMPRFQDSR